MERYQVSARKYRPSRFEEVVGQEHITSTLINAIQTNQLAQAFLFCGPRGIGKTSCARILAKVINTENPQESVKDGSYADSSIEVSMNIFELDAASNNSVEDIRNLIEQVRFAPQSGTYKVYIIDEVHMLSTQAFNAFLKTLEEPPPYAIFILATTEKHKILPTILSRCQTFNFKRIGVKDMAKHLANICEKEGIEAEEDALHLIAIKADGALRDALSIFDRMASFSNKKIEYQQVLEALNVLDYDYYFKITDSLILQDAPTALRLLSDVLELGFDGGELLNGLANHFRDLLFAKNEKTVEILEISESLKERYLNQSTVLDSSYLLSGLSIINTFAINYKTVQNKQLQVELALLKIANIKSLINISKLSSSAAPLPEKKNEVVKAGPTNTVKQVYRDPLDPRNQQSTEKPIEKVKPVVEEKIVKEELTAVETSALENEENLDKEQLDGASEQPKNEESSAKIEPPKKEDENKIGEPKHNKEETVINKSEYVKDGLSAEKPKIQKSLLDFDEDASSPSILSLAEIEKEEVEKEKEIGDRKRIEETDLTTEDIQKLWSVFKESLDSNQSKAIFKKYPPVLDGGAIFVVVSNSVEQARVREEGVLFIETVTKQYGLIDLALNVSVDKSLEEETEKKLFTPQDKLQAMVEKNPAVEEFRRRLFLEIKY